MAVQIVARPSAAEEIGRLLDSPEVVALCDELEGLRWTGRKGYGSRALVGACLVKSVYAIPTWSRTAALIGEHAALQTALGGAPSVYACYRFAAKLREHKPILDAALGRIVERLSAELPEYGQDIAIDASDLPAYANGQRYLTKNGPERERYSDPGASWGHRSAVSTRKGGGFYGWKLHLAVCTRTDLPIVGKVETARTHEASLAETLLQRVRDLNVQPQTATLDKGYDTQPVHDACHAAGCLPVIPLKATPFVKRGDHRAPTCDHGTWKHAPHFAADVDHLLDERRRRRLDPDLLVETPGPTRAAHLAVQEAPDFGDLLRSAARRVDALRKIDAAAEFALHVLAVGVAADPLAGPVVAQPPIRPYGGEVTTQ